MTNSSNATIVNSESNSENLETAWLEYWSEHGESILLSSWQDKYGDYIKTDQNETQEELKEKLEDIEQEDTENSKNLDENNESLELKNYDDDWKILWEKHCEEEYYIRYQEFYQNFNEITLTNFKADHEKYCIESKVYTQNELENSIEDSDLLENTTEIEYVFLNENDKLSSFGLPTSFGRKKIQQKDSTISNKRNINLKDYIKSENIESTSKNTQETYYSEDETILQNPFWNMDVEGLIISKNKTKQKKRKGVHKNKRIPQEISKNKTLIKYWQRRFSLFSLFNNGIKLDEESWFSVTPEKVAAGIAERLKCDIIVDAFCGCGGNTIQFALNCNHVIAIDIDAKKIEYAKHNAKIYNVENKIDFIIGDFLKIYEHLKADVVFLSPPWGGPNYTKNQEYDIENDLQPISASALIKKCKTISNNIAIYLPRNSQKQQIIKLAGEGNTVEITKNILNDKFVAITAFYGDSITNNR